LAREESRERRENAPAQDDRVGREKRFHERFFTEGGREHAQKFAVVTGSITREFDNLIARRSRGRKVLDCGCGEGWIALLLAQQGADVVGIDVSEAALAKASEMARAEPTPAGFALAVMDSENLGFRSESFDIVLGRAILHHLTVHKALTEMTRVLKPQGSAFFVEPLGHNPAINLFRRLTPQERTPDEHPLKVADLKVIENYFDSVEFRYFYLLSLLAVPFRGAGFFHALLAWLERVDEKLFRWCPWIKRYAWQVLIRCERPRKDERS
jgi:ubiquinone/menaquinone biosynthesis C-methylase UbiE